MNNIILDEYKTLLNKLTTILFEINTLPQGYISKKNINGKQYFYLQNRLNGKVLSKYIKEDEVENISASLELLKKYKSEIPKIQNRLSELEKAAKLIDKNLSRELMLLKLSSNMDCLTLSQKNNSISFANAMNAIEGVDVSSNTQNNIDDWKNGDKSFLTLFNETLTMYGFNTGVNHA